MVCPALTQIAKPMVEYMFNKVMLPEAQRSERARERAEEQLQAPLDVLDAELSKRTHLVGDRFTVADLNVAAVLLWTKISRFDLSARPHVARWLGECLARPAAQAALAQ